MISRYYRHPLPPTHSSPILNPTLSLLTCAYAEERSISAVAAAKHCTTKEMRTSDSNHQEGRWQNKGGRWWSEKQRCAGRGKERRKGFLPSDSLFHTFPPFPKIHQDPFDICLTGVTLISLEGRVPLFPSLHATPSLSPFLFPSIYISNQAMSRSKTVTNDEAFHQRLAWYAEIAYSQVSLIVSRWVCFLARSCVLLGSCHFAASWVCLLGQDVVNEGCASRPHHRMSLSSRIPIFW